MFIKPDYNLDNIYEIDFEELQNQGIKGLLFDLDSTVMVSKSGKYLEETKKWLEDAQKLFAIAVVTNNKNPKYLEQVKSVSFFPVYSDAKKPDPSVIQQALQDLNLDEQEAAFVGDRPLTDILGGKKAKVKCTILVDSINAKNEDLLTRFVRKLERLCIKK